MSSIGFGRICLFAGYRIPGQLIRHADYLVDEVDVLVLDVSPAVAAVVLAVLPNPLFAYLMEPVPRLKH